MANQEFDEVASPHDPIPQILEGLSGEMVMQQLRELAQIGGIELKDRNMAVSRLALSNTEIKGRMYLADRMRDAGMTVEEHPLGLIGRYEGIHPSLPPVAIMSHHDSVPNGGMFDGTVGVISGIAVVRALHEKEIRPQRSIIVLALTGEESSRFNMALFGSRGVFHGLTEAELHAQRPGDVTIQQALEILGLDVDLVRQPRFRPGDIHALVELHVSQDGQLEARSHDLAVIEAIAAPHRLQVRIGDGIGPLREDNIPGSIYRVDIVGKGGHSGATPMGREFRADGLLPASDLIRFAVLLNKQLEKNGSSARISVGSVTIEGEALNKIPGNTSIVLKFSGNEGDRKAALEFFENYITSINFAYTHEPSRFDTVPVTIMKMDSTAAIQFFTLEDIMRLHGFAGKVIRVVNTRAHAHAKEKVVGTVGTYAFSNGQIILGVDVRGIDLASREQAVGEMQSIIERRAQGENMKYTIEKLPGSGEPTPMDTHLVKTAIKVIAEYGIGTVEQTFSPAGHDAQNAARAGIPTVMLFIPSRNGGLSHVPQEYSTPRDLEIGARALAALVMQLTQQ